MVERERVRDRKKSIQMNEFIRSKMIFAFECAVWIELAQIHTSFYVPTAHSLCSIRQFIFVWCQNQSMNKNIPYFNRLLCKQSAVENRMHNWNGFVLIKTEKGGSAFDMFVCVWMNQKFEEHWVLLIFFGEVNKAWKMMAFTSTFHICSVCALHQINNSKCISSEKESRSVIEILLIHWHEH